MANMAEAVQIALEGTDNVSSAARSAEASLNSLDSAAQKSSTSFTGVATETAKMAAAFGALAATGIVAGFAAATTSAMGFEKQISAISAVTGASQSEIAGLSATALQLGKDTSFSASEAATGMEELAKAGVSMTDIMGGAGRASLDLAAAGAISVGDAAEIASNAMNVFGIKGADMAHVADQIAGAANASAIGVNDYKFSLSAAGAVAATVGVGFEDLTTAIAVMGQAGIKGSDAGTSLKTMLLNLSPTSKTAISEMKQLGIITEDGANAFFTAEGKAKSLGDISQILQEKMAGLTKEQQLNAMQTMFGTDAIRAAAVMAAAGAKGFDEMAASIGKVSAQDVANERLNNLSGSIEKLKGSAETFAIMVGSRVLPLFKSWADAATEGMNRAITVFEDGWTTIEQVFAGDWSPSDSIDPITNAIGEIGIVIRDDVMPVVNDFMGLMGEFAGFMADHTEIVLGFGAALLTLVGIGATIATIGALAAAVAFLVSPIGLVVAGVGLLTAAWVGNWGDIQGKTQFAIEAITGYITTGMEMWQGFWSEHGDQITTIAVAAWDFISAGISNSIAMITGILTAAGQAWNGDWAGAWDTIVATSATIWEGMQTQFSAALTILSSLFGPTWTAITTETTTFLTGIQTEFDTQTAAIQATIDGWMAAVTGIFTAGWAAIQAVQTAAWNMLTPENQRRIAEIQVLFGDLWTMAGQIWTAGTTAITTMVTTWWTKTVAEATTQFTNLSTIVQAGWDVISGIWTTVTGKIAEALTAWWTEKTTQTTEMMTGLGKIIQDQLGPWVTWFQTKFTEIGAAFTGAVTQLGNAATELGTSIMTSLSNAISAKVNEIVDKVTGSVKSALESAKSLLGSFQWGAGGGGGQSDVNSYLRASALRQGVDPEQVLAVMGKEGPGGWNAEGHFSTGDSYGPLQLHYAGGSNPQAGMGDRFTAATGIDLRTDKSMQAQQKAIDYAISQLSERGNFSEWYGADTALPGGRFTPVRRVQPQTGLDPAGIQMMNQTQQEWAKNAADANSICGPYLASLFADAVGRPPDANEARAIAESFGYGGTAGMLRNDTVDDMANAMIARFSPTSGMRAVSANVTDPAAASRMMQQALAGGSPLVGVNTQGHYFGADAYDPTSNKFHVGGTGTSLSGGSDWLTVEQMTALMGPLNGIITLTGQGGAGFLAMGTDSQTMATTGQAANDALLLSTTTLSNGATVAISQMGNDVTATITDASGVITGQWTNTVTGMVTGAQTAQAGVNGAVDVMTANSIVSVNNMGQTVITSVADMAGTTIATTTDMSGQVIGLSGTLSSGVSVNMSDMGTNVVSSVDAMTGTVTTTMTTASGDVVTTTTDMAGKVLDQWVTLGTNVTTEQTATAGEITTTEQTTAQDVRDINRQKNLDLLANQKETGRGLIESTTNDLGVTVERWMTAGGDIETIVKDSNGMVLSDFRTAYADIMGETDRTHSELIGKTTDTLGRTVEIYRERSGEVVEIVSDSSGNIVEEYENTAKSAEDTLSTIEDFYGGLEEVPDVDLSDVVKEYDKARKAAEDYRKEADRAPDPSKNEGGRDRAKGGKQYGGRITPGDLYWVGEGGRRELFMSDRAGQILADEALYGDGQTASRFDNIGDMAAQTSRTMILKQEIQVNATAADLQRYTERAMRKLASEWGTSS